MQLQEFFDYKNQLMKDMLSSKELVRLLNNTIPFDDAGKLAYTQVFPFEYIPATVEDGWTYVCFDVDIQESLSKTYLLPTLNIWIMTHQSNLRLPEGGVRTDKICSEICNLINGSRRYGLGELNLYAVKRFSPVTDYNGKVMIFHAKDFNRLYDPTKEVPANRKRR